MDVLVFFSINNPIIRLRKKLLAVFVQEGLSVNGVVSFTLDDVLDLE